MKIRSLENVSISRIHAAFAAAFADYVEPFTLGIDELHQMLRRRGFDSALSFGAFDDDEIVGFTLNGRGVWNGLPTAYDTGTGVRKEFRKQGIASRIFEASLPPLRDAGIKQYLLEVIRTNQKAVDLYLKTGFSVTREFDYWVGSLECLGLPGRGMPAGFELGPMQDPDWFALESFWDHPPSWQNSADSLGRMSPRPVCASVTYEGSVVAYGCMDKGNGDLPQLAVHPEFRRKGVATALLAHLVETARPPGLRVINTDAESVSVKGFLGALGLEPGAGQYEMIRDI